MLEMVKAQNSASPLVEDPKAIPGYIRPDYSEDEIKYLGGLQVKLEDARDQRDQHHEEFDGMTFLESWLTEERSANTFIQPKQNKEDTRFQSGTIRQKLFALLGHINNLDLTGDINAYNDDQFEITALGNALELIIAKTEELDNDAEKKFRRQYELLKHGYVFVEEIWEERWSWAKPWIQKFEGKIKSASWKRKLKMLYARPVRNIIPGPNVYLGDISVYDFCNQPYVFTVKYRSYQECESIYGAKDENGNYKWERWPFVTKSLQTFDGIMANSIAYNTWRLTKIEKNVVEEIHYQDKYNNDYAILLNGVLMTPVGMPLPWGWEDYNLTQQNLEPIRENFAYGKSVVARLRVDTAILDEMLRLAVLKTQKSFMPPYLNMSGKVVSQRVFMPGKITSGLSPGDLAPVHDKEVQGVTASEFNMIQRMMEIIDSQSVSPQFSGISNSGDQTATETMELSRQAKQALGIFVFACSLLEWKLTWLRLFNVLENWFNPVDQVVDEARNTLKNKYRVVNMEQPIEGEGMGRHMVVPTDENYTPDEIKSEEDKVQDMMGQPVRITAINPEWLKTAKLVWQITVTPREKQSSELNKILFRGMLGDIQLFGQDVNWSYLEEKFARTWDEDPNKLFNKQQIMPMGVPLPGMMPNTASPVAPGVKVPGMPSPEGAMHKTMESALAQ